MSEMTFEKIYGELKAGVFGIETFVEMLRRIPEKEKAICKYLCDERATANYDILQSLVVAAINYPSKKYVVPLCDLLYEFEEEMNNEDIVDALYELQDERCIPVLSWASRKEIKGDHYHHFNRKCIEALIHIGTKDSVDALQSEAIDNPFEESRRTAAEYLRRD